MAAGTGWQTCQEDLGCPGIPAEAAQGAARREGTGSGYQGAPGRWLPAAPCRPALPKPRPLTGLEVSGGAGAGRFQPQPIFGESLLRLRHPALGGGGGGGPRNGSDSRALAALLKSALTGPRTAGPGLCGLAGSRSRGDCRCAAPARSPVTPRPAVRCVGGWRGGGRCPVVSLFPSIPLLTRAPSGTTSCWAVPDLEGTPRSGGEDLCVRGWRLLRHRAHPRWDMELTLGGIIPRRERC
ncbi:N(G),N(G)-dimethylarginine dimethylaminohydrolase 1 isoform X2 [Manis pentadactyla]|uniref:N(G),N(G)-dimethylarginine dimethylaminohydrolase 1 isoform X2 n=1 Tax=Manis pentadactyla TaxID=143292 RepID=UPI001874C1AF|nr:N(G),N(G)-dimethylarginine dimethylaminohydrolase 1 isoform X2 [Manis pentadactyla]XP_057356366.1 N(G),N(G)-dimethylarginine dimethylaminohydrolase 1 isoform X2 [Manis pentadactyla]XP_057356367.1 N(G),N(G)-dimethylarginine dimethylaminohydrolase 1 isoform X2 [Manis pentadactyla]